jgi:hypothetical protein
VDDFGDQRRRLDGPRSNTGHRSSSVKAMGPRSAAFSQHWHENERRTMTMSPRWYEARTDTRLNLLPCGLP